MDGRGVHALSMAGGIDAWQGLASKAAVGQGMSLVAREATPEEVLLAAYGLEEGARRFYRELAEGAESGGTRDLFEELAAAEVGHEAALRARYGAVAGAFALESLDRAWPKILEGGRSAEQVLSALGGVPPDTESALDLAMSLETESLDLYLRLARAADVAESREVFRDLAELEKGHLKRLAARLRDVLGR